MLMLTQKEGQWITIGDNIRIFISEARDGKARLGIEAPREVKILRDQLHPEKDEAKR